MLVPAVQSQKPVITRYRVPVRSLPAGLEGFTILQVSDLHSQTFQATPQRSGTPEPQQIEDGLTQLPADIEFDLAALPGDLINGESSQYYDAPVYYVTGNHEWSAPHGAMLLERLNNPPEIVLVEPARDEEGSANAV